MEIICVIGVYGILIFRENMDLFDEDVKHAIASGDNPLEFPGLQFTVTAEESKALNEREEPCIIISASGMCEVGRIKHHLKHNLWNPKSTILFVGYQAPGTLGSRIVNGEKKVKIFGDEIAVNARIEYIEGYSGHADQEWLLNFVYSFISKPKHIFLVHGEPESQEVLKEKLEEQLPIPVHIPEWGETYELENLQVEKVGQLEVHNKEQEERKIALDKIRKIKDEVADMEDIIKEEILTKDAKDEDIKVLNLRLKELENQIVRIIQN